MFKPLLPIITLFILACPTVLADANTCQQAVEQKHFERLSTACINLPHRDRMKKMRLMMAGDFSHYLGTIDKPTKAFEMLRKMAESNDSKAQYMYGHLYGTVHIASQSNWDNHIGNNGNLSVADYNNSIRAEANNWLVKAADGGHSLAMLEVAEGELLRSYTQNEVNLRAALQLAANAESANPILAKDLIKRIRQRIKEIE